MRVLTMRKRDLYDKNKYAYDSLCYMIFLQSLLKLIKSKFVSQIPKMLLFFFHVRSIAYLFLKYKIRVIKTHSTFIINSVILIE